MTDLTFLAPRFQITEEVAKFCQEILGLSSFENKPEAQELQEGPEGAVKVLEALTNMARILRSTAEMLESAEAEAQEPATGRMHSRTAGSGSPTTHSPPPCPSSSRTTTTEAQELQEGLEYAVRALEEQPRIGKNQDMSTNVAKILRSAAKLLESTRATSNVCWAAEVRMALPQLSCSSSSLPKRAGSTEPAGEHATEEPSISSSSPRPGLQSPRRGGGDTES